MTSQIEDTRIRKKKLFIILGIAFLFILVVALTILHRSTNEPSPSSTPTYAVVHINIPSVQYPTIPPSAPAFSVTIRSLGLSGITGTATFEDVSGAAAALLTVDGMPDESLAPAELRYGACSAPGPIAYPLTASDDGGSETDLSINLKQFNTQKPMAVIVYASSQDHTAVACGDIP